MILNADVTAKQMGATELAKRQSISSADTRLHAELKFTIRINIQLDVIYSLPKINIIMFILDTCATLSSIELHNFMYINIYCIS